MLRLPIGVADSNERKATRNTLLVEREILAAQKLVERARLIGPHRAVHGDTARHDPAELRASRATSAPRTPSWYVRCNSIKDGWASGEDGVCRRRNEFSSGVGSFVRSLQDV